MCVESLPHSAPVPAPKVRRGRLGCVGVAQESAQAPARPAAMPGRTEAGGMRALNYSGFLLTSPHACRMVIGGGVGFTFRTDMVAKSASATYASPVFLATIVPVPSASTVHAPTNIWAKLSGLGELLGSHASGPPGTEPLS